jgi:hypothetical protein
MTLATIGASQAQDAQKKRLTDRQKVDRGNLHGYTLLMQYTYFAIYGSTSTATASMREG